jgi:hypothetical protein
MRRARRLVNTPAGNRSPIAFLPPIAMIGTFRQALYPSVHASLRLKSGKKGMACAVLASPIAHSRAAGSRMAQRVPFIVAELGRDADPFMLHLYAALAEKERWPLTATTAETQ